MANATIQRPAAGVTQRRFSAACRVALGATVEHWHGTMMPRHFTTAAMSLYGYAPRTKPYMIRKARKVHHQRPLVGANPRTSGDSQAAAKNDVTFRVRKVDDYLEASAVMLMPDYFVQHPHSGARFIDKKDELTRTTAQEERELAGVFAARLAQDLGRSTFSLSASA